jgi:hypothetical protein
MQTCANSSLIRESLQSPFAQISQPATQRTLHRRKGGRVSWRYLVDSVLVCMKNQAVAQ